MFINNIQEAQMAEITEYLKFYRKTEKYRKTRNIFNFKNNDFRKRNFGNNTTGFWNNSNRDHQ